jgi:hypothetical protein
VVNELVILVDLEDELVVYAVAPENHDADTCCYHDPSHDETEDVNVLSVEQ